jgi:acetolactate decarboxylase
VLREVLHEGKTQAKVRIADVSGSKTTIGVGAVEGLNGEIVILDGQAYVSSVGPDGKLITRSGSNADVRAALLITADVPRWQTVSLDSTVGPANFDQTIRDAAIAAGVEVDKPFPFVISGTVASLEGHVINGACPSAGTADAKHQPYHLKLSRACEVTLVGIYADNAAGVMTHHDSKSHVHALTSGQDRIAAHVDHVSLQEGASLRLPARK